MLGRQDRPSEDGSALVENALVPDVIVDIVVESTDVLGGSARRRVRGLAALADAQSLLRSAGENSVGSDVSLGASQVPVSNVLCGKKYLLSVWA
jgi:hypothetical protein